MPTMVRAAMLLMTGALTFYSVGVWSERLAARLKPWHVGLFWLGFLSDTAGTDVMRRLVGGFQLSLHTATGAVALLLMLAHAAWATGVLLHRNERAILTFHRVSILVWTVWLLPFVTGMVLGLSRGR
jgi:uncharacterized repeat protein (TIGR03987 family)